MVSPLKEVLQTDMAIVFDSRRRVNLATELNCKHWDRGSRRGYSDRVTVLDPAQTTYYPCRANAASGDLDVAAV